MKIDKLLYEHFAELRLRGEFDTFYAPKLQEEIDSLIAADFRWVILNLRLVKFINSTALGAIIKANKRMRAEGGELVIAQPSAFAKEVLTQIGIDKAVPMFAEVEEAQEHLMTKMGKNEAPDVIGESNLLFEFEDDARIGIMGGRRNGLGTVLSVDHEGMRFKWDGGGRGLDKAQLETLFAPGQPLKTKFKIKLHKKDYFHVDSTIESSEIAEEDGTWTAKVAVAFSNLAEADSVALAQFADDLDYLKQQLKDIL